MPARRLVWMTGLTFQTRLRENPNPLAFKGLAGRRPLGNARNAGESPRHGSGACRGSAGRDQDNSPPPDQPTTPLLTAPPKLRARTAIKSREGKRHLTRLPECSHGNAGAYVGARQVSPSAGAPTPAPPGVTGTPQPGVCRAGSAEESVSQCPEPASCVRVKNNPPHDSVPGFQASGNNFQVSFPSPGSLDTPGFPPFSSKPVWNMHAVSRGGGTDPQGPQQQGRGGW